MISSVLVFLNADVVVSTGSRGTLCFVIGVPFSRLLHIGSALRVFFRQSCAHLRQVPPHFGGVQAGAGTRYVAYCGLHGTLSPELILTCF